jgi:hypothetical protein
MTVGMNPHLLLPIFFCLCVAPSLTAQSAAPSAYTESFRKGPTRILEATFEVRLTPQDSVYRERIKDSQGADRYVFSIVPKGPEGDTKIRSWQAILTDLHYPIYDNILLATRVPSDDPAHDPKNGLWRLEPGSFAAIPVGAKRVIKVDGFYVVLQVTAYHFSPPDSPYLDSMTVQVEFRNTDPRQAEGPAK